MSLLFQQLKVPAVFLTNPWIAALMSNGAVTGVVVHVDDAAACVAPASSPSGHALALAVAGLLSSKMYGPPVRPPQPNMGLRAAFGGGIDWKTSAGEDRYRRGLYTTWRRSNPYPSMATFDAPNREVCTVRRDRTNTPLQALVTLNDPVYVEAAQSLARIMLKAGENPSDRLKAGFERCLARSPGEAELDRLVKLFEQVRTRYAEDAELAKKMATDPLGPAPKDMDLADLASLTVAANVLLNLDEILMKR